MSSVTHVVLFQFKPETSSEKVLDVCKQLLALEHTCVSTTTNKPYIKSIKGGSDNSPEGAQAGATHGFVVEFETEEDRDYYVREDPSHAALKKFAGEHLAKAIVVDFSDGFFGTTKL